MNNYDDNQTALTSIPQSNRELSRDQKRVGGYPAYSRYPAVEVEKNSVREYFRIIRRHKWIVLATLIVLTTIVTIGTMLTKPVYRAEAKLEIGKETERVAQGRQILEMESASVFNPFFLQTQVDILHSRDLARRVIQKLNLAENDEFSAKSAAALQDNEREVRLVNAFQGRYDVSVGRQTRVVSLTFDAYNPKLAADVANAIASEYITWSMESRLQGVSSAKDFLAKRVQEAETALRDAENEQQRYLAEHRIISVEDKGDITLARTVELNRQLTDLENERRTAEANYNRSKEVAADELPQVINDATVQNLSRELSKQKQELANLSAKYQPNYPAVKQVQEQVKQLETQLTDHKAKIVKNIETQFQVAKKREEDLKASFGKSRNEAIQQNRESSELGLLKQKVETNQKNYEDLLGRLRQAEVESDFRPSNIRKVQEAEVPIAPVKPKKALNIGLSVLIGLALGIGLAFFMEYLNNTVNTAEDVERIVQLPALGGIPSLQSLAKNKMLGVSFNGNGNGNGHKNGKKSTALATALNNELLSGHDPLSSFAESYRALRTSLLLSSAEHAPRTMLITSSHPAEGKTTIVANTAISLAQTGARVLVLDADMRRPRCHKILSTKNDSGLSTYLSRDVSLDKVITQHDIPNLYVMPAGPVPPNPSELLSSIKFGYLVTELQEKFDHIIIDSPPVIHVTDALIISPHVDGVVIVVKSNHTPREAIQRAKQALADVNAKIFGVVLNCIDLNTESYYYNYKYAYYHSHEESSQ
ncbi:MAG: polysaccharide biosynthesis tyrosine autokinase [Acidobacteriota bacterium]|nr:polysaccharide biosynthesis tyrosine autokinase [Acidobacteriota bacterium]